MAITEIFNFAQINDRIATGGQPTADQLKAAREAGYEAIVNLAPHDAENNALEDEPELAADLGFEYFHIPIVWTEPKPEHFTAFCAAMEQVGDRKVLVHCAANYRVSAVVSSYAIKHLGWSVDRADELVNKIWTSIPEYTMDDTWRSYIETIRRGA